MLPALQMVVIILNAVLAFHILFLMSLTVHDTAKVCEGVNFFKMRCFYFETGTAVCIYLKHTLVVLVLMIKPVSAALSSKWESLLTICWWLCNRRAMSSKKSHPVVAFVSIICHFLVPTSEKFPNRNVYKLLDPFGNEFVLNFDTMAK